MSEQAMCNDYNAAIPVERNKILMASEKAVSKSSHPAMNIVRNKGVMGIDGNGINPKKVRMQISQPAYVEYADILQGGLERQGTVKGRGCDGKTKEFDTNVIAGGNCGLPEANQLAFGFDEYHVEVKGLSYKTPVFCAWDFYKHGKQYREAFFSGIRKEFPKYGHDNMEQELQRAILRHGESSVSVAGKFNHNLVGQGIQARPQGIPSINFLKRHAQRLRSEGFPMNEKIVYYMSQPVVERIIQEDKKKTGVTVNATPLSNDFSLHGSNGITYQGINFVFPEIPNRAYIKDNADGSFELVAMFMKNHVEGTGGGIVEEYNPYFDECTYVCNGKKYQVAEIAYFGSSEFLWRKQIDSFQLPGQGAVLGSNFQVKRVDGASLECNDANEKMQLMMQSRFMIEPNMPEHGGALVYLFDNYCDEIISPCCDDSCDDIELAEGTLSNAELPIDGGCGTGDGDCEVDDTPVSRTTSPTVTEDACGDPVVDYTVDPSTIFASEFAVATDQNETGVALCFERAGDDSLPATVTIAVAAGTAVLDADFAAITETTLSWVEGDIEPKCVTVPILALGEGGDFTVTISNATAGTITEAVTTVTVDVCDGTPDCEPCDEEASAVVTDPVTP